MLREHPWAILIILLLIVLLFGSSKLPDLARNLGRSMRIVKKEVREMKADDEDATPAAPTNPSAPAEPQQPAAPQQPAGPAGDDAPKA
ncbi:Sec-independent protein translocase subunit TatA [Flavimobilis rhizosphaerae]|uniref:Sec-independent protein translocase subunit TatA n=1 Tax=Flavimobilis rhizosphaerae TaxID=2775421 RepID=UPI001F1BE02A|nr:Sec-independent protein translocase subunit TatA [Flavimobilis rhizosphaerae]